MHRRSSRFRAEWLLLAAVLLAVLAVLTTTLYREFVATRANESERLRGQARVIDENVALQVEGADKALLGMSRELRGIDLAAHVENIESKLKLLTDAMPGISSMLVLDHDGQVLASSRAGLQGKNFRQREYFDAPRRGGDPDTLYVSPPFHTTQGTFVIVVSHVLTGPEHEFAGVITATLDPDYFNVVLRSVLYAPDMRSTLIHHDGHVFLNEPDGAAGHDTVGPGADTLLARHLKRGEIDMVDLGGGDTADADRMIVLRNVMRPSLHTDKPMVVQVSRALGAVYLPWRARCWGFGAAFLALILGASLALFLNQGRRRELGHVAEAVAEERRLADERLALALRGADLGLWDLHVPDDTFIINQRERELLGYGPEDPLPQGRAWRELIHPDDRALVAASIVPHSRGEADNYECEHRMRHRDGHDVWVSNRAMIVERDARGAPLRIVGTHLDITERKAADARLAQIAARLRDSEDELRQVTDNMPALVSRLDVEQRFRFVNRAYRDWLDIDPATMLGRTLAEVYGEPAYRAFEPRILAALGGERVVYERDMATPHGMRRVEVTVAPQRGGAGQVKGLYALIVDITARHQAELKQQMSEERLSLALEGSSLALFDWDLGNGLMYHSAQAAAMRGEALGEVTRPAEEFQNDVHPEDRAPVLASIKDALAGRTPVYNAEFRIRRITGEWFWLRARGRVVQRDAAGHALRLAGTYADIDDSKRAETRLRRLAEFDTLTGLPNRAHFNDRLQQALLRAARGKPMALLFLDIDHFKTINDTLGHDAGDQLLKIYAMRMQATVRDSDTVARLAGDEFTIILEGLRDVRDAEMLAGKLVHALHQPLEIDGVTRTVSASVGVAMSVPGEVDEVALLRRADAALYGAKREGRDRYHCSAFGAELA